MVLSVAAPFNCHPPATGEGTGLGAALPTESMPPTMDDETPARTNRASAPRRRTCEAIVMRMGVAGCPRRTEPAGCWHVAKLPCARHAGEHAPRVYAAPACVPPRAPPTLSCRFPSTREGPQPPNVVLSRATWESRYGHREWLNNHQYWGYGAPKRRKSAVLSWPSRELRRGRRPRWCRFASSAWPQVSGIPWEARGRHPLSPGAPGGPQYER